MNCMKKNLSALLVAMPLAVTLSGCGHFGIPSWDEMSMPSISMPSLSMPKIGNINSFLYRPDVAQGNLITEEMLSQIQTGMSRSQVHFILGEPLIKSDMHLKRWDYIYYYNPRMGEIERRHLVLFFDESDRLERFDTDKLPSEIDADAKILSYTK